jgi:hypothetical protein
MHRPPMPVRRRYPAAGQRPGLARRGAVAQHPACRDRHHPRAAGVADRDRRKRQPFLAGQDPVAGRLVGVQLLGERDACAGDSMRLPAMMMVRGAGRAGVRTICSSRSGERSATAANTREMYSGLTLRMLLPLNPGTRSRPTPPASRATSCDVGPRLRPPRRPHPYRAHFATRQARQGSVVRRRSKGLTVRNNRVGIRFPARNTGRPPRRERQASGGPVAGPDPMAPDGPVDETVVPKSSRNRCAVCRARALPPHAHRSHQPCHDHHHATCGSEALRRLVGMKGMSPRRHGVECGHARSSTTWT